MLRRSLLLLPLLLLSACSSEEAAKLNTGDTAPAFAAERSGGGRLEFPAALIGKPVVLRFWADWCRYCAGEMQAIDRVWQRRRSQGLEVLAVNVGQDEATVAAFMARIGVSYPALVDPAAAIAKRYGVVGLPTTFFVDRQGKIQAKVVGEADEATFDRLAGELLR